MGEAKRMMSKTKRSNSTMGVCQGSYSRSQSSMSITEWRCSIGQRSHCFVFSNRDHTTVTGSLQNSVEFSFGLSNFISVYNGLRSTHWVDDFGYGTCLSSSCSCGIGYSMCLFSSCNFWGILYRLWCYQLTGGSKSAPQNSENHQSLHIYGIV